MPPSLKHFPTGYLTKFMRLALITLIGLSGFFGQASVSQAASLQESFRGTFLQEPYSAKGSSIYSSIVFVENTSGNRFSIIAQSVYRLIPEQEYLLNGIVVQKHLPKKPKADKLNKLIESAWPDGDPAVLESTAKELKDSLKRNPDKPLVLVCSLRRADIASGPNRKPLKVGANTQEAKLIKKVAPSYPQATKPNRNSAKIQLQIIVDEEGNVEEITPKGGDPRLVTSAIDAVQRWQYSPTLVDGNPVPVQTTITFYFQ
jgi:TonB family protein